ncbi:thermostable hemolysin [Pseudomonas citronellolis]|uniref:thermostable hemolysin n=1 Tax=Pseudomonas citronellolis TaxID=53408 RepID=UPI0023E40BCD|nr:thermostable hemolysin [Pseudomonas citronellolis]MDF3932547.1 thermostable hemolysin [Pseudomonas citronellolis]
MNPTRWNALFPFHFGSHPERRCSLLLRQAGDADRERLEAFIHERFEHVHHADVHHYLPELLGLHDSHGRLIAVVGMRLANTGPLFLERYLDEPLEAPVSRLAGRPVARDELVEVGNLAALSAGAARLVIIATTWLLAARDLHWVAFTGAAGLVNSFHRLGLEPNVLASADPERLAGEEDSWGSYYAQHPRVFAGDISYGQRELERSGAYQRLGFPLLLTETGHAA